MWHASEGLFTIILIILAFGIISLPYRSKKVWAPHTETGIPKGATDRAVPDSSIALQQAALGKRDPESYSTNQKTAGALRQAKVT